MPPGTPVLQPIATDKDADLNAKIRWDYSCEWPKWLILGQARGSVTWETPE
jgi:hypothetical protein